MRTVTGGPFFGFTSSGDCLAEVGDVLFQQSGDGRVVRDDDHDRRHLAASLLHARERRLPGTGELLERAVSFGQIVGQRMRLVVGLDRFGSVVLMCSQRLRYFGTAWPVLSSVGVRGIFTSPDSMASTRAKSRDDPLERRPGPLLEELGIHRRRGQVDRPENARGAGGCARVRRSTRWPRAARPRRARLH